MKYRRYIARVEARDRPYVSPLLCARLVRSFSLRRGSEPLSSGAGIWKVAEKVHKRVPVAREGRYFTGILRFEFRRELGQFRVRQAGVPMMHTMIWLMEQSESDEPAERPP